MTSIAGHRIRVNRIGGPLRRNRLSVPFVERDNIGRDRRTNRGFIFRLVGKANQVLLLPLQVQRQI